ncbi:unnamed protein product [Boreogadus saida]
MEMEARATEAPEAPAEAVPRITGNWWCACRKCRQIPTQYRLVAYRVILEWALKGQPLDEEIALDHPDVWCGL